MALAKDILEQDIFEVLKLTHLTKEQKAELFDKAQETIMYRVMSRLGDQLPDHDLEKLKVLLEKHDQAAVDQFFDSRDIDIDQVTAQEALAYKVEMASLAQAIKPSSD